MAGKGLVAQTTREAPSAPVRETFIASTLLPVCCACGLVQDKAGATPDLERLLQVGPPLDSAVTRFFNLKHRRIHHQPRRLSWK